MMSMRKRSLCAQALLVLLGSRDMSAPPAMSDSERERGAEVTRSTCQASSFYASASNHISWSNSCISVTVAFLLNEAMLDICEKHRPLALVAENVEGPKQKPPRPHRTGVESRRLFGHRRRFQCSAFWLATMATARVLPIFAFLSRFAHLASSIACVSS